MYSVIKNVWTQGALSNNAVDKAFGRIPQTSSPEESFV